MKNNLKINKNNNKFKIIYCIICGKKFLLILPFNINTKIGLRKIFGDIMTEFFIEF